ncbi:recombinase family protein [Rhizobium ruizarguesonis]|uniref:recombinase family protein n=1 Tax=Rhizobium ruizarguesonis TaxID=2081791 RepID=UPI0037C7D4CD
MRCAASGEYLEPRRGRSCFTSYWLCRVSTKRQNLAVQLDALSGADCDTIYTDTARGSDAARKGLNAALHKCRSGDQFVIWRLDRLSRRLVHLVATVEAERGVNVRVLSGRGTHANFSDPEGRFVLGVIASFAQLEHETGAIRTRHAMSLKNSSRSRRKARPTGFELVTFGIGPRCSER